MQNKDTMFTPSSYDPLGDIEIDINLGDVDNGQED